MYDNDEEIRKKRRNLLILIGVVVFLIIILLFYLLTRGSGKKTTVDPNKKITCELEVKNVTPNESNTYNQEIEVGFKTINLISQEAQYGLQKSTVGTTDNSRNQETYKITKAGVYQLHGYIQDKSGNKGTCDLTVTVNLTKPTCELEVTSGTLGNDDWYRSDVVVGFKSMSSNSDTASIVKYYIEREVTDPDTSRTLRSDPPANSIEKLTVKDNLESTLIGYVIDSNGSEGTCTIKINKDSTAPTCKLKVMSGTPNSSGIYTGNPVIGINDASDSVSEVVGRGVGVKKNYTDETYTVTADGKTKVYGYVKDAAGNEGTCSIEIKRPEPTKPTPTPTPTPTPKKSSPSCSLKITSGTSTAANTYIGKVTLSLTKSTTGGASITGYGIAESKTTNGKTSYSVSSAGTHIVYGMVKDSYGNTAYCQAKFTIKKGTLLSKSVQVGSYVNYDAGTWNQTITEQKIDGYTWGIVSGQSKSKGVICNSSQDKSTKNGWVVLTVTGGKVVLVSAGTPECMYHSGASTASQVVTNMNNRANQYLNKNLAESASILNCNSSGVHCAASTAGTGIFVTGTHYYLASAKDSSTLWGLSATGRVSGFSGKSMGIRPVIVLKADVLTTSGNGSESSPFIITR